MLTKKFCMCVVISVKVSHHNNSMHTSYPAHMRKGYGSRCVCVCVCVHGVLHVSATYLVYKSQIGCYKAPCVSNVAMHCVDFAENTLFSSFGVICLQLLPSMLSDDETSMDRMNNSGPTIFKIQSVYFQR